MTKDFLDPKQNPMIRLGDEDGNPRPQDEDGPGFNAEDFRIPLGGYPEKKAAAASSPADPDNSEKAVLEGINDASLLKLMGPADIYYVYDPVFYDEKISEADKLYMQPVISLTKRGSEVAVNRLAGGQNILTKGEAETIRSLMKRESE